MMCSRQRKAGSSGGQTIGNRMTMGRICAFGVYVIGAECRDASVSKGPAWCRLAVDCVVSIEFRRSDEDRDCQRGVLNGR
jgi:hypothetical protein